MGSSRVEQALNELDPGSRAVVDLSLGTDFSDENIATLIRVEPDEVARRRERAIDALQQKLGGASHDDVVMELCAAMGVEPSPTMLQAGTRNGSARAATNGTVETPAEAVEAEIPEPPTDAAVGPGPSEAGDDPVDIDDEAAAAVDVEADDSPAPPATIPEPEPTADLETTSARDTDTENVIAPHAPEPEVAPNRPLDVETEPDLSAAPATDEEDEWSQRAAPRSHLPPPPPGSRLEDSEDSGSRRRIGVLLAALAAGVIIVGGIVALSSGGGESSNSEPAEPQTPATEQPAGGQEQEVSATLEALPDAPSGGGAEVTLEGDQLTVSLDGLPAPEGTYEAWLFTSVLDSRPLGSTDDGSGMIRADLPDSADRYEYLDVSIQPTSTSQHSGQSIFRVPVADLLG